MTADTVFAFDIETVPDVEFGRRKHGLEGLAEKKIGYVMQTRQREQTGSEALSLEQHRVIAIAVAMRGDEGFRTWSLGDAGATEAELVRLFFDAIARFVPLLVSWNGTAFDLPVLQCRAMRHGLQAQRLWDTGGGMHSARRDDHSDRPPLRQLDMMDVLSGDKAHGCVQLSDMAELLGLPGGLGMTAEQVLAAHLGEREAEIRDHCEIDALNTYLVYLRFELMRGRLSHEQHAQECAMVRAALEKTGKPAYRSFLEGWVAAGS